MKVKSKHSNEAQPQASPPGYTGHWLPTELELPAVCVCVCVCTLRVVGGGQAGTALASSLMLNFTPL